MMQENDQKNNAQQSHHECQATEPPSADELRKQYKDSQLLTAGQVFGLGNGRLGKEVHDEVIRRNEARKEREAGIVSRKKSKLRNLISCAKLIEDKMRTRITNSPQIIYAYCSHTKRGREMQQYPLGRQLFWLDGMKLSTALHHKVAQTIPKLRRKKK